MLFSNNDSSRGLVDHMRQPHPRCGQLAPSAAGCVIFRPMDWYRIPAYRIVNTEPSGTVQRKYTGLPRRIDRNEYYFALLYIVRQVIIPYSALQFRRNSAVFWCFEIPCQDISRWRLVLYFPDTEFHTFFSGQVPISSDIHVVRTFPDMSGARLSCRSWPDCSLRPFP